MSDMECSEFEDQVCLNVTDIVALDLLNEMNGVPYSKKVILGEHFALL
jgi:hypothetical protein